MSEAKRDFAVEIELVKKLLDKRLTEETPMSATDFAGYMAGINDLQNQQIDQLEQRSAVFKMALEQINTRIEWAIEPEGTGREVEAMAFVRHFQNLAHTALEAQS